MAYTRAIRRRKPQRPALGMGTDGRSFIGRFFFPDGMVDPDSTNDRRATRKSAYRISLLMALVGRVIRIGILIRDSLRS